MGHNNIKKTGKVEETKRMLDLIAEESSKSFLERNKDALDRLAKGKTTTNQKATQRKNKDNHE